MLIIEFLIFPYPTPGHIMPLLDLAHQLSICGLTIIVLVTPKNLSILRPLLIAHPSITPLVLPFPPHPSLPSDAKNVKDLSPAAFPAIMHFMRQLHAPIIQWFRAHPLLPVAIISDMFFGGPTN
ncbi:hypothetical protein RHGRI_023968 [Rhododendron griersonianum]|uniref:Uncharacterized protein n=1 Tax=Rhododendron griersonianum TaxID=479676 RepID=A0AAV6J5G9_9ERIC|nr:hypothetical protein RHGRI_023968 [Rhododendron griersonianum]